MAGKLSAGLLLYRRVPGGDVELLLVHPGGPFWAKRDEGSWSVPKGEYDASEDPLTAARREFAEELGSEPPPGEPIDLGEVRQASGKVVTAWGLEGDLDAEGIVSNTFEIEWPPRSGRTREFPEVDRAGWFDTPTAKRKLIPAQAALIDTLRDRLGLDPDHSA